MRRSERQARDADGVLFVLDGSRPPGREDKRLLEKFQNAVIIIVINKIDVLPRAAGAGFAGLTGATVPVVEVSALKGTNIDGLKSRLYGEFQGFDDQQADIVLHLRQKLLLEEMLAALEQSRTLLRTGYPDEILAEELRGVLPPHGRLTGEIRAGEVVDDIFGRFCVGK